MYYIVINWPGTEPQFVTDKDGNTIRFETEQEAIKEAKEENFAKVVSL